MCWRKMIQSSSFFVMWGLVISLIRFLPRYPRLYCWSPIRFQTRKIGMCLISAPWTNQHKTRMSFRNSSRFIAILLSFFKADNRNDQHISQQNFIWNNCHLIFSWMEFINCTVWKIIQIQGKYTTSLAHFAIQVIKKPFIFNYTFYKPFKSNLLTLGI